MSPQKIQAFSDIFGYNLSTKEEFPIATGRGDQYGPAIYGDIVVWQDYRHGDCDIYGYDLSTGKEFQITSHPEGQKEPAISFCSFLHIFSILINYER
ncbi:MAG: hypothetical protein WBA22_11930 [Candidatus Methanofastidiosia archaeon]